MNYSATAKKVAKQLAAKGTTITIVRPGDSTGWTRGFDALTGEYYWEDSEGTIVTADPAIPTEYHAAALVMPASAGAIQAFDIRFEGGTMVESNLRSLMIEAADLEITPKPGDTVKFGGETWTLLGNTPLMPDGKTVVYHQCTAKRGGV